jgi:hypothetical protein
VDATGDLARQGVVENPFSNPAFVVDANIEWHRVPKAFADIPGLGQQVRERPLKQPLIVKTTI